MKSLSEGTSETCALLSGSEDGKCMIWKKFKEWKNTCTLTCLGIVNCVASMKCQQSLLFEGKDIIVTGTSEGFIQVWLIDTTNSESLQVSEAQQAIQVRNRIPLCMAMSSISGIPILACSSADGKIDLYVMQDGLFTLQCRLAGHENWVRGLSFATIDECLYLCSGSQDKYIRIWKIHEAIEAKSGIVELISKEDHIVIAQKKFEISLEALLLGHEDWVMSVQWAPLEKTSKGLVQPLKILSSSADKTMMIWEPDASTGIWINTVHIGEIGGNSMGLYGALFSPDGSCLISHGYSGSFNLWIKDAEKYSQKVSITGHRDIVEGISWSEDQKCLLSVSKDQTARIYCKWQRNNIYSWHEIARPQIHGYDIKCVAYMGSFKFISGSDEKVLREFEAPKTFARTAGILRGDAEDAIQKDEESLNILGANVPALGLSNKAVFEEESSEAKVSSFTDNRFLFHTKSTKSNEPFTENELVNGTLWPEINKLYGHVYEIFSIEVSNDKTVMASAAKASSEKYAAIRFWDTKTWQNYTVNAHSLTVTKISFSNNDKYVLTVSRDRHWALFEKIDGMYQLVNKAESHSRIIWGCCWTFDDLYFATCSRDRKIQIWQPRSSLNVELVISITCEHPVTSIDFYCKKEQNAYVLAAGFENGDIKIYHFVDGKLIELPQEK